jgi:hypothetical protein
METGIWTDRGIHFSVYDQSVMKSPEKPALQAFLQGATSASLSAPNQTDAFNAESILPSPF